MFPNEIIFVSMENWDDIWRRNQFICAELCRRHLELRILFVAPPRDFSNALRRGQLGRFLDAVTYAVPGFDRVTVTRPPKFFPNSVSVCRRVNELLSRRHVRRVARRMGFRRPLLWLNPHDAVHMVGRMNECLCVYDITDDWTAMAQSLGARSLVCAQDSELCRKADATIVCSKQLFEMKRELTRDLHLIPNGVDIDHYARVLNPCTVPPSDTLLWKKPVLGYSGTIHPQRVDVQLVVKLARSHSGSIVLLGPNSHLPRADRASLEECGNIHLPGPVPYIRLPDYMAAFDVCITPHHMTPFTESLNPIKLWEYLAAGLPMVSMDVAGFRDYPDLVHLARNAEEFVIASRAALAEGHAKVDARRAEAKRNSWAARVDRIEAVIQSSIMEGSGCWPKTARLRRDEGAVDAD